MEPLRDWLVILLVVFGIVSLFWWFRGLRNFGKYRRSLAYKPMGRLKFSFMYLLWELRGAPIRFEDKDKYG